MRFILDTHALIWFISDADRLSHAAVTAIRFGDAVYALVAQAEIEQLTLITCDELIAPYSIATLW